MKIKSVILLIAAFVLTGSFLLDSCKKHPTVYPSTPLPFVVPPGFPQPVYNFEKNPTSEEDFLLGRKLFYDGRLSINGNFACASCHQQVAAFTTYEHDRSHGYNNSHTLRNAPGLFNLAWYPYFNQDGSAPDLESVIRSHITNPTEMAESISGVVNKLKQDSAYKRMFFAAYGSEDITAAKMFDALSQFVLHLVSANSRYDKVKRGEANFTAEEQSGYTLFKQKCASCHQEPVFTDFSFRNTGFEIDPLLNDYGRMRVTKNKADSLKFRVPSLRNVELTSYYGHDGRLSFMRMMIQHYRLGIKQSATLDPLLTNGISLTNSEENALVAFLRTLSDSSFINNPRFRD